MITYQDFLLFCTFIVALISLLYRIFKGKKQPPLLPIVTADCLQQKFKLIMRGRAASMAFPFSMLNIAHLAAGFKSQTHVYCNVVAKAVCCPLILLSGDSTFQNTHRNTPQAHISHFKGIGGNFHARQYKPDTGQIEPCQSASEWRRLFCFLPLIHALFIEG